MIKTPNLFIPGTSEQILRSHHVGLNRKGVCIGELL